MALEIIGKQIALLRKEKGMKQEELASYVGVSAQAVSKWENGGVPDTELLPRISFLSLGFIYSASHLCEGDNRQAGGVCLLFGRKDKTIS